MRKIVVLCLALLLPILIFLFLKFFGKNEFNVAPLYQQAEDNFPADCNVRYTAPYTIPDSVLDRFNVPPEAILHLVIFEPAAGSELDRQVNRIKEMFADDPVSVTLVENAGTAGFGQLKKCVFLLQQDQSVVLVDSARQIRGQYNGASLEEADRLIVELKILLKQY